MPRTKKPAGTAADPRNGRRADLAVVPGTRVDPPEGISEQSLAYWESYWDDAVAQAHTTVDRVILVRWITELDRYFKLLAVADAQPIVEGSQGQPVENPAYATAHRSLTAVQYCEKQLGIGPLHRSALGIAVIAEKRSLDELNQAFGGGRGVGGQPAAVEQSDPRVVNLGR